MKGSPHAFPSTITPSSCPCSCSALLHCLAFSACLEELARKRERNPPASEKRKGREREDVGLGAGGDRGGAVRAAVAGAAAAAAREAPLRGVRQHAHQRHGHPRPRHHLLRPHRALRHRHRRAHHH
uniref:Uncharacterized protein n=1 Tax=Triticum urartu TaxID=4572 RepID=A0A8R7RCU7_TRIUA